jgi:hypothetical protein
MNLMRIARILLFIFCSALFTSAKAQSVNWRTLRWSPKSNAIFNIGKQEFTDPANWLVVINGQVSTINATPANYDSLQIDGYSMVLTADCDISYLDYIMLDFRSPKPGTAYSLLVKKDNSMVLSASSKIFLRTAASIFVEPDADDPSVTNTRITIGLNAKIRSSPLLTDTVKATSLTYADATTPVASLAVPNAGFMPLAPLPVRMGEFDAIRQRNVVKLSWKTQQEANLRAFNVERSTDGKKYTVIASVAATGNATTPKVYSYEDATVQSGIAYYRIRSVGYDLSGELTPVRAIRSTATAAKIGIYPNPAVSTANIIVSNPESLAFTVNVFNRSGQLVAQRRSGSGTNTMTLDLGTLAPGDYSVDVRFTDGTRQSTRLVVNR